MNSPNKNQPLLPSQREAYDTVLDTLQDGRTVVLRAMSGVGKTRILKTLHQDPDLPTKLLGAENWQHVEEEVEQANRNDVLLRDNIISGSTGIIKGFSTILRRGFRGVLAIHTDRADEANVEHAQYWNDAQRALSAFNQAPSIPHEVVDIRTLSENETAGFARELRPDISPSDLAEITEHALGIPLIIARSCEGGIPAQELSAHYLIDYFEQFFSRRDFWIWETAKVNEASEKMCVLARRLTGREVSEEVIRVIRELLTGPISTPWELQSILPQTAYLTRHFPPREATMEIYRNIANDPSHGAIIRIFIPDCPSEVFEELFGKKEALLQDGNYLRNCRLKTFGHGSLRKTVIITPEGLIGDGFLCENHSREEELEMQMDRRGFGKLFLEDARTFTRPYCGFVTREHPPMVDPQIRSGLAIESYLQGERIDYLVNYSARAIYGSYRYDGASDTYEAIEG